MTTLDAVEKNKPEPSAELLSAKEPGPVGGRAGLPLTVHVAGNRYPGPGPHEAMLKHPEALVCVLVDAAFRANPAGGN